MNLSEATRLASAAMSRAMARTPSPGEMRVLEAWQRGRITDAQLEAVFGSHIWKKAR